MSKRLVLRAMLTFALAIVLYRYVEWAKLVHAVSQVDVLLYSLSTAVFLASFGLLAWRLKILLAPTAFGQPGLGRLFIIHMSSVFYGFVVPSDIGTAVARWYQLTRNQQGRSLIALITLLERLLMLAATSLFALVALYFSDAEEIYEFKRIALPAFATLSLILIVSIVVMLNRGLFALFGRLVHKLELRMQTGKLQKALALYWRLPEFQIVKAAIGAAGLVQLCYQFLMVARFVLLFHALDLMLPPMDITWISMAVILLTAVPVTIAGLGIREGGFAAILIHFSVATELGVLVGLLAFSQLVCAVVWGGISALLMKEEVQQARAPSE